MPTSPKLATCFKIVSQIVYTAYYSSNKHDREKNLQNPNEVWCTEKKTTTLLIGLFRCSTMIMSINYKSFNAEFTETIHLFYDSVLNWIYCALFCL